MSYKKDKRIDRAIDRAYRKWDGRPMDYKEIAKASGVTYESVKNTGWRALQKIKSQIDDSVLEYLE